MSPLVARLLLAMLMLPLAVAVFVFVVAIVWKATVHAGLEYPVRDELAYDIAAATTWALVAIYWCGLWRSTVRWRTNRRIAKTFAATALALIVALAVAGVIYVLEDGQGGNDGGRVGSLVGGWVAILTWLLATTLVWLDTRDEHNARVNGSE